jgi:hypothetical protein
MTCPQLAGLRPGPPRTPDGCEECLKAGTQWAHLWASCYADALFAAGDRNFSFYVVKSGGSRSSTSPATPPPSRASRRGEFTGDVAHLTGRPALVTAVTRTECEVYEVSADELADRAVLQVNKFGARLPVPTQASHLSFDGTYPVLHIEGGETVSSRSRSNGRRGVHRSCWRPAGPASSRPATCRPAP